jgi:hypothetical protein
VSSIGSLNETDLHEQLKHLYAGSDGLTEATVEGFVIDVVRGDELVEVQTSGLGKLRRKIEGLSGRYRLRIVYPVAARTRLVKMSDSGEVLSQRRSPKRGRIESIFRELTSIADLLPNPRVTVEIVLLHAVERRVADGRGSWRRRGVSIVGRAVEEIVETAGLRTSSDYLALLPHLSEPFTNKDLAAAAGLDYRTVQPMTSCFRKMGLIEIADKKGRVLLYRFT